MLRSSVADTVAPKIQCSECLWWSWRQTTGKLHRGNLMLFLQCLTWFTSQRSLRRDRRDAALLHHRYCCNGDPVLWVSVMIAETDDRGNFIVSVSLGSPARPRLDAALLHHQCSECLWWSRTENSDIVAPQRCCAPPVLSGSECLSVYDDRRQRIAEKLHCQCLTWFTRKASPRCCAPLLPIRLPQRFIVVSVCDHRSDRTSGKPHCQCLTWFTRKASPRYCAPPSPILL